MNTRRLTISIVYRPRLKAFEVALFRGSQMVSNPVIKPTAFTAYRQAIKWQHRYGIENVYSWPMLVLMKEQLNLRS